MAGITKTKVLSKQFHENKNIMEKYESLFDYLKKILNFEHPNPKLKSQWAGKHSISHSRDHG